MLIPKRAYHKRELFDILHVSENDRRKGDWQTGYIRYNDSYYVFVNIGGAGRTGHDYDNHWEGEKLVWYSKNRSRIGQPVIDEMLSGNVPVHIFTRTKDRDPFVYEGIGIKETAEDQEEEQIANQAEDITPVKTVRTVKVVWDLELELLEDEVNKVIEEIIEGPEAPDDKERHMSLVLKRARKGQDRFKKKQLEVYDGQCCITGCGVQQVLKACHIEPHFLRGNNHSCNALLLRADIHDLFDLHLIAIEPGTLTVHVSPILRDTEYRALHGTVLRERTDRRVPDTIALEERWRKFWEING